MPIRTQGLIFTDWALMYSSLRQLPVFSAFFSAVAGREKD
jgi:hypothetical protein